MDTHTEAYRIAGDFGSGTRGMQGKETRTSDPTPADAIVSEMWIAPTYTHSAAAAGAACDLLLAAALDWREGLLLPGRLTFTIFRTAEACTQSGSKSIESTDQQKTVHLPQKLC